jgi:DNA-binding Xre family transcriptional regulator
MTSNVPYDIIVLIYNIHLDSWQLDEGGVHMYQYKFADNLCRLCKEQHISVEELADKIEKSPRQVSRYRNGQCGNLSLSTLAKIATALNVSITDLLL